MNSRPRHRSSARTPTRTGSEWHLPRACHAAHAAPPGDTPCSGCAVRTLLSGPRGLPVIAGRVARTTGRLVMLTRRCRNSTLLTSTCTVRFERHMPMQISLQARGQKEKDITASFLLDSLAHAARDATAEGMTALATRTKSIIKKPIPPKYTRQSQRDRALRLLADACDQSEKVR